MQPLTTNCWFQSSFLAFAPLKRQTLDDLQHKTGETVLFAATSRRNLLHSGAVMSFDAAPQRVSQQLLGQGFSKSVSFRFQNANQLFRPLNDSAIGQRAGRINRKLPVLRPPGADRVVNSPAKSPADPSARDTRRRQDSSGAVPSAGAAKPWNRSAASSRAARWPGGGGGGAFNRFSKIHLPRSTGEVRLP